MGSQEYGPGDPLRRPRGALFRQKLTLALPTSGSRSAGMVRSQTQATEFSSVMEMRSQMDPFYNEKSEDTQTATSYKSFMFIVFKTDRLTKERNEYRSCI
jgi:hypothetical protein